jgi:hypothetical protein
MTMPVNPVNDIVDFVRAASGVSAHRRGIACRIFIIAENSFV